MMQPHFETAASILPSWVADLMSGKPPTRYRCGEGELGRIELGPGLVTLIGGPPGAGKTAFALQLTVDALRLNNDLRAVFANVEVPPMVLLERIVSRLSGVGLAHIRARQFDETQAERLNAAIGHVEEFGDRLAFLRAPFTLESVAQAGDQHDAALLVLDYLQRFTSAGESGDRRAAVDGLMSGLRNFADHGAAVLAVSAVGRQRDAKGRTSYSADALGLGSFRESSELEFGADDAFMLAQADGGGVVTLRHLKARHSEPRDLQLRFDGARQSFESLGGEEPQPTGSGYWRTNFDSLGDDPGGFGS
jgi:replicative DNA helicase